MVESEKLRFQLRPATNRETSNEANAEMRSRISATLRAGRKLAKLQLYQRFRSFQQPQLARLIRAGG